MIFVLTTAPYPIYTRLTHHACPPKIVSLSNDVWMCWKTHSTATECACASMFPEMVSITFCHALFTMDAFESVSHQQILRFRHTIYDPMNISQIHRCAMWRKSRRARGREPLHLAKWFVRVFKKIIHAKCFSAFNVPTCMHHFVW